MQIIMTNNDSYEYKDNKMGLVTAGLFTCKSL